MNTWYSEFAADNPVAHALLVVGAISALGLTLGSLRYKGLRLGVTGVLFFGLIFGHLGATIENHILDFTRDFGLVLFVYCIGVSVGPGFVRSLRTHGAMLNGLALVIVGLGAVLTVCLARVIGIDMRVAAGIFSGATTNTPALGAAQEALRSIGESEVSTLPALGYAVTYPLGILGILFSMLAIRALFRVDVDQAIDALNHANGAANGVPIRWTIKLLVESKQTAASLLASSGCSVVISRVLHAGEDVTHIVHPDSELSAGDIILVVGLADQLQKFQVFAGKRSSVDLTQIPGAVIARRIVVTREAAVGRTIAELEVERRCAVTVTRIKHLDVERVANPETRLRFGDTLLVVGENSELQKAEAILGNSRKAAEHLDVLPVFIGLVFGLVLGFIPIPIPGIPTPVRLGVAGGPLIAALILSRIGNIGCLRWHMSTSVNSGIRDLGITLFLASVGVKAGAHFVDTFIHGDGLIWLLSGAAITVIPLVIVGVVASLWLKTNFLHICGLLAGSMTDPPALAFATIIGKSEAPAVSYAAVYPLTMITRIVLAQVIVLVFAR